MLPWWETGKKSRQERGVNSLGFQFYNIYQKTLDFWSLMLTRVILLNGCVETNHCGVGHREWVEAEAAIGRIEIFLKAVSLATSDCLASNLLKLNKLYIAFLQA